MANESKPCNIREQVIDDAVLGMQFQFETVSDGKWHCRTRRGMGVQRTFVTPSGRGDDDVSEPEPTLRDKAIKAAQDLRSSLILIIPHNDWKRLWDESDNKFTVMARYLCEHAKEPAK